MQTLLQDLRYGARMLLKQPGFTLLAVLTLALGIGANTAIFSVVNALLLTALPLQEPERIVLFWNNGPAAAGGDRTPLAVADLLDVRAQNHVFEQVAAFQYESFALTGGALPEWVRGASVTANFFTVLGVQPSLGRSFLANEEQPGAPRAVILSDACWRSRFGADPQLVGRTIKLNENSFTVVGVMPAALNFPLRETELWTARQTATPTRRGPFFLTGLARLKAGVSLTQAAAALRTGQSSFDKQAFNFNVLPVNEFVVGEVRPALWALLVAVTLVLLIAAVNVANLTLVRATARLKEISIRAALGAGRGRLLRQLLTESLLLALLGGVLGTLGALWGVELLVKLAPSDIPRLEQIRVDGRVLSWTLSLTLLSGFIAGLGPIWQSLGLDLNSMLKDSGRGTSEGGRWRRWRNALVVAELALAVLLLSGSGLLLKSLWRLQQVDLGVDVSRVGTYFVELPSQRYAQPQQLLNFYAQVLEKARALPGVQTAALSNSLPPDITEFSDDFEIEGRPRAPQEVPPIAAMIRVSPSYFNALRIPLNRGRVFTEADTANTPLVAVLSETAAQRFFPNENPLGQRLNMNDQGPPNWVEIVGVVNDVKYNGLTEPPQPAVYQPLAQAQATGCALILKTTTPEAAAQLTPAVQALFQNLDRNLPLLPELSLQARLAQATAQPRFRTTLMTLFAGLALVLACIGIYGVISYTVTQRRHEIGIRLALGAQRQDVLRLVLRQGLTLALAGVSCGLGAALALTPWLRELLFAVPPSDPLTFASVALLLLGVALLACWLPAWRAAKVDPLVALRQE